MVYSEALFFPLNIATNVLNLKLLLSAFSKTLEEGKQNQIDEEIILVEENESVKDGDEPPGFISLCNKLIKNETNNSLVWIGQNGFIENISALWRRITPALRESLSFRFCFVPQEFGSWRPTIIYTPSQLAGRWIEYQRISPADIEVPQNKVVSYLLGQKDGEGIRKLLLSLEFEPIDWESLRMIEQCADYQIKIDKGTITLSEFRGLLSRIAVLVPDKNKGREYKKNIFEKFCRKLINGNFDDLFATNNLDIQSFPDVEQLMGIAIKDWLKKNLLKLSATEASEIFLHAKDISHQIWGKSVLESIKVLKENWNKKTALVLWQWWKNDDKLFQITQSYLPKINQASEILIETFPINLPNNLGNIISEFAIRNKQWKLYAMTNTAYLSTFEAILNQLKLEPSKTLNENSGFPVLFKRLKVEDILNAILKIKDTKLLPLLAQHIVTNPRLLKQIDLTNLIWQKLILLMLEKSNDKFWQYVPNPQTLIFQILDLFLAGDLIELELLSFAASSKFSNLFEYPQRRTIWTYLNGEDLERFLFTTANYWLLTFANSPQFENIEKPEQPLKQYILIDDRIQELVERANNPIDLLLKIFKFFEDLSRYDFENLLYFALAKMPYINQVTAIELGKFISEKDWKNCADVLKNQIDRVDRQDLLPALQQCSDMFGWLETFLSSTLSNLKRIPLRWEDWWESFTDCLIELYKDGPTQNHLWKRAGGDESVLLNKSPGRDSWLHALHLLRNGGGGKKISTTTIIEEVKADYYNNEKIELLERLFYQLGGTY